MIEIKYQNICESDSISEITKRIAKQLMEVPYMKVGSFFQNITENDLTDLIAICNAKTEQAEKDLFLISEMLSRAEGVFTETDQEFSENIGYLVMLIAAVDLARKGAVKLHYDKISFSRDMMNEIILEKLK